MNSYGEKPAQQLTEYRGPLTPSQVAEGMNAAGRNARRLAADAQILLEAGRFPTAAAIAALSIEESGKPSILRGLALTTNAETHKMYWKQYRDHRSKNGAWILPDLVRSGARRLRDLESVVDRDGEHTAMLNALKQIGLYTDCYGNIHWSNPDKIFDDKNAALAKSLVKTAELLAPNGEITTREIELWVQHMKPSWGTSEMPHALIRFSEAMYREGLSKISPEEYASFVFGQFESSGWKTESPKKQ